MKFKASKSSEQQDILSVFNVFMIGHVRHFTSVLPRLVI